MAGPLRVGDPVFVRQNIVKAHSRKTDGSGVAELRTVAASLSHVRGVCSDGAARKPEVMLQVRLVAGCTHMLFTDFITHVFLYPGTEA